MDLDTAETIDTSVTQETRAARLRLDPSIEAHRSAPPSAVRPYSHNAATNQAKTLAQLNLRRNPSRGRFNGERERRPVRHLPRRHQPRPGRLRGRVLPHLPPPLHLRQRRPRQPRLPALQGHVARRAGRRPGPGAGAAPRLRRRRGNGFGACCPGQRRRRCNTPGVNHL